MQVLGACLLPKRALQLMEAEVDRLFLLGKNAVVPLSMQVPRKVKDASISMLCFVDGNKISGTFLLSPPVAKCFDQTIFNLLRA